MDQDQRSARQQEAQRLAEIGRALFVQALAINVSLPTELATSAVAAWNRADYDGDAQGESDSERVMREHAGALALIGLAIEVQGVVMEGERVNVQIDAWQIGNALDAAQRGDLLTGLTPPTVCT